MQILSLDSEHDGSVRPSVCLPVVHDHAKSSTKILHYSTPTTHALQASKRYNRNHCSAVRSPAVHVGVCSGV